MEREFKDSGIEWIGKIPMDWKMQPLAVYFAENSKSNSDLGTVNALQFKYGEIIQKPNNGKELTDKDRELLEKYIVVSPNDIVVNGLNLNYDLKSLRIAKVREDGIITSAYIVLRSRNGANASFYNYYLKALDFQKIFHGMGVGIRLTLSYNELRSMLIPVPSKDEQQRIADYLDKKCGEIDELIALQEQMIAQLTDYKQSVITEAVTKGLNPDAELVLSGIDWIGDVPKGWKVAKAKYFVFINNGSDPQEEGDIPVYGSGASSFKTCGEYKEGPTVLIGRKGATLHIPHYIEGKYWNVDTAFDVKIRKGMSLRFYYYLAICFDYKYYISQTTLPGMAQSSYYNMNIPVPPLSEQQAIATYLDTKCSEIDSLIAIKQQKIETLKDYKKSVIYEAVTGKMTV